MQIVVRMDRPVSTDNVLQGQRWSHFNKKSDLAHGSDVLSKWCRNACLLAGGIIASFASGTAYYCHVMVQISVRMDRLVSEKLMCFQRNTHLGSHYWKFWSSPRDFGEEIQRCSPTCCGNHPMRCSLHLSISSKEKNLWTSTLLVSIAVMSVDTSLLLWSGWSSKPLVKHKYSTRITKILVGSVLYIHFHLQNSFRESCEVVRKKTKFRYYVKSLIF